MQLVEAHLAEEIVLTSVTLDVGQLVFAVGAIHQQKSIGLANETQSFLKDVFFDQIVLFPE